MISLLHSNDMTCEKLKNGSNKRLRKVILFIIQILFFFTKINKDFKYNKFKSIQNSY